MAEDTITPAAQDDGVVTTTEPTSAETTTEAVTTTAEPSTTTTETSEPSNDDDNSWLQNKGIDLSTPEGQAKAIKSWREAEKAMHQSTAKASELEKTLTTQPDPPLDANGNAADPMTQLAMKVQAMETAQAVNNFFISNPDAKALEGAMTKIVTDNPTIGELVKNGYLNIGQLYAMAKGSDASLEDRLKKDGGHEALEEVAKRQRGSAVQGKATSSDLGSGEKPDLFREALLGKV